MKILCLGDSQTFGFGVQRRYCWTTLAQKRLGHDLVNRGIPGDTTGGMLARYVAEIARYSPQAIVIMGGSNDVTFGGTDAAARANVAAIAHQSAAHNILPIICTPPPKDIGNARKDWAVLMDYDKAEETMNAYSEWLRTFAGVFSITLVDYRKFLLGVRESGDTDLYVDGIHLNPHGHELVAEYFCEQVQPVLGGDK